MRTKEFKLIHLNSCGISPTYPSAAKSEAAFALDLSHRGTVAKDLFSQSLALFKDEAAKLLRTSVANISFIRNAAEGLNAIAHGLRLEPGDEVVSYRYEYPSNHYPWRQQEKRGVKLVLLEGELSEGRPCSWKIEELVQKLTSRTKVVAVSHVQFTSGFAADLKALGELCRARGIFLVVDAAQSLGALPIYPEEVGVDALVSSGWKWLLGPVGSAVLYTSARLRDELEVVYSGPDMMVQGDDYLNHQWEPFRDGRFFEFSTLPYSLVNSLGTAIRDGINRVGVERIWSDIKAQREKLVSLLEPSLFAVPPHEESHWSGILSCTIRVESLDLLLKELSSLGVICSARGGYLRIAPHYWVSDEDLADSAEILNHVVGQQAAVKRVRVA